MSGFYEKNYNGYDKNFDNPIRYAGQYWDSESGMYYMRARYYDPSMKRFTQEDPIRDGMNWYAYCEGNPVMRVDVNGLRMTLSGTGDEVQILWQNLQTLTDDQLILTQNRDDDGNLLGCYTVTIGSQNDGMHPLGAMLVRDVITSSHLCNIAVEYEADFSTVTLTDSSSSIKIKINPRPDTLTITSEGRIKRETSPVNIGMAHELIHTWRYIKGYSSNDEPCYYKYINQQGEVITDYTQSPEELATTGVIYYIGNRYHGTPVFPWNVPITENDIRIEQGLNVRINYAG